MSQPPASIPAAERRRLRRHQFFTDHGIFRELFYANFHRIAPGVFRSAQPSPRQLRRWHARYGIRTVLNIRAPAPHEPHYRLQQEVCDALGMIHLPLHGFGSRDLPRRADLLAAIATLRELEGPLLIHCKSGADRAGFISVLYLHLFAHVPIAQAGRQLRLWPFGHIRHANTGILDCFFESYQRAAAAHPGLSLQDWIEKDYDREAVLKSFRPWYRLDWLTDRLLHRE